MYIKTTGIPKSNTNCLALYISEIRKAKKTVEPNNVIHKESLFVKGKKVKRKVFIIIAQYNDLGKAREVSRRT